MLLKNNRNRTYNWVKFNQLIEVKDKDADSYLEAWFIEIKEKDVKTELKKTKQNTSKPNDKDTKKTEVKKDENQDDKNEANNNKANNDQNVWFDQAKKKAGK